MLYVSPTSCTKTMNMLKCALMQNGQVGIVLITKIVSWYAKHFIKKATMAFLLWRSLHFFMLLRGGSYTFVTGTMYVFSPNHGLLNVSLCQASEKLIQGTTRLKVNSHWGKLTSLNFCNRHSTIQPPG